MTWAHYRHGMNHLARAAAQEKLRVADAMNAAQGGKDYLEAWQRTERALAGYLS